MSNQDSWAKEREWVLGLIKNAQQVAAAASVAQGAAVTYEQATFTLAQLQALGATTNGTLKAPALPANARVLAQEISIDAALVAAGLASAYVYSYVTDGQVVGAAGASDANAQAVAGSLFAQDLSVQNGRNVFATQGGNQPSLRITTAGANLSTLSAGQITLRTYYAIIP